MLQPHEFQAVKLLSAYTAGRFDIWTIAGPRRASCRAHVMSVLLNRKTPQAQSGVNAIRDAFYRVAGPAIVGDCINAREESFVAWAREVLDDAAADGIDAIADATHAGYHG